MTENLSKLEEKNVMDPSTTNSKEVKGGNTSSNPFFMVYIFAFVLLAIGSGFIIYSVKYNK